MIESKINAWLKPLSFTSDLNSGWGGPWEILRTTKLSADGRAIEIFHKSGGLPGYYSIIMLIPEFNLGFTLLYAGDWHPVQLFREDFLRIVGEEIEKVVRADAKKKYSGFYKADSTIDSSLELAVDSGPGIKIVSWISNGTNFINSYWTLKEPPPGSELRLIPTSTSRGEGTEVWRAQISSKKPEVSDLLFDDFCMPHLDFFTYFNRPADEFVLKSVDGIVEMIELTGFRVQVARTELSVNGIDGQTDFKNEL